MWDLFQYSFMQRAIIVGTLVAIVCPLLGTFLVVKRFSALADTLSHVSLVGISLALIQSWFVLPTAIAVSVLTGMSIEFLRFQKKFVFSEASLVMFLTGSLAISSLLMSTFDLSNTQLLGYLFGSISTTTWSDVWVTIGVTFGSILIVGIFYRQLFTLTFEEELAQVEGLPVRALNMGFIALSSVVISVSLKTIGALLIGALIVIPVISALQFRKSFAATIWISIFLSVCALWIGLIVSFYLNVPSGPGIVITNLGVFALALGYRWILDR